MASYVQEILGRLTAVPSIIAAVLMKPDGSMIERAMSNGIDPETVRASMRDMLSYWEWAGSELGMGRPYRFVLESATGPLGMIPVGPDAILVAMGSRSCRIGQIRRQMQQAKDAIRAAESTAHSAIPDLGQILAGIPAAAPGGAEIAQAGEPASPREVTEEAAGASAGEVVVIGVTTFRLAARLLAAVSNVQGVCSVRLRAYAPGTLTIDCVFQGGGTLASITERCFEDCSLHVIERTATRLVLGLSSPVPLAAASLGGAP